MRVFAASNFPSIAFKHWWPDDCERGVVVQKATFSIGPHGQCDYLQEQPGLLLQDAFTGAPNESSALAESDLAPCKTGTDVLIDAVARSPGGEPLADWRVGVSVPDRLSYGFQVCGPRWWRRERVGWRLGRAEAVVSVPLLYELAYGGTVRDHSGRTLSHEFNPIGAGLFSAAMRDADDPVAAPQIGQLAEFMQQDPLRAMSVCGTRPLGRAWLPRRALGGTFDEQWRVTRHPRMPPDYDFGYWNAAPAPLQARPFLRGDEIVELNGMSTSPEPLSVALPGVRGVFRLKREGRPPSEALPMALDTVMLALGSDDPALRRLSLTWRANFDRPDDVEAVQTSVAVTGGE